MASILDKHVQTVQTMFRQLTPSCFRHMEACRRRAFCSAMGLVEGSGSCSPYGSPPKGCLAQRMGLSESAPCSAYGTSDPLGKCALLGVWKPVEGMHSFRRWQEKMPQWGPIAWIRERAARKRHDGAFSRADILRPPLFGKLRDLAFVELSYSVRAFAGFSLRNEVCRGPLSRFLPSGLETLQGFLTMRFGVRCLRQEIGAVFEYHVFYGREQQKRKHQNWWLMPCGRIVWRWSSLCGLFRFGG